MDTIITDYNLQQFDFLKSKILFKLLTTFNTIAAPPMRLSFSSHINPPGMAELKSLSPLNKC